MFPQAIIGQWTRAPDLPISSVHNVYLPNGKIMLFGRFHNQGLWDPVTQAVSALPNPGYDLFCAGHGYLADGRVLVPGGHRADFVGLANASVYDPRTNSWTATPDMNAGRWYPTVTTLPNGDALVTSGTIDSEMNMNPLPQVYQAATNSWRNLTSALLTQPMYPMMFVAPNGRVVDVGPSTTTRSLDTSGAGNWTFVAERNHGWRDYGTAAMYAEGKILVAGGGDPPQASVEVIDLNAATPSWRTVQSMSIARRHLNSTILPDGTVLVTGGSSGAGHNNANAPVLSAQLWNPATETWTTLSSGTVPRLYHSAALLLPDGRVVVMGGERNADDVERGIEFFSPPYLFKGARPAMSGVPTQVAYGQRFTVQSAQAARIAKVTLIRLSAVTHAFNMDQRFNVLPFTPGTGALDITAPANANLAPPGFYMLFLVDANGAPSVGAIVRIGAAAP
ncbi:MAG TPA: galactose oxidase-like domain-containing protein [Ramlibacter sp.]|nr:galactose oxidase-like domain-containing protein [Ramlibacter sp.]